MFYITNEVFLSRIGALEFAKRFWVRGGNIYIEPIYLRLALLTRSPFGLVAFGLKYGVKRFSTLARLGGAGYRVAGSCGRKLSRRRERIRAKELLFRPDFLALSL